jgi:hypothetical protein
MKLIAFDVIDMTLATLMVLLALGALAYRLFFMS